MLRDSVVVVVRTRPRAIPLAMITMRKSTHGFPSLFYTCLSMGLRLAALLAAGAPLLFNYMMHVLHKMPYDRRRKAYRLPQMIKHSFQHKLTAFVLWPVKHHCKHSSSSKDVHSRTLYRNLNLHPTTTLFSKVSRGPIVAHSP